MKTIKTIILLSAVAICSCGNTKSLSNDTAGAVDVAVEATKDAVAQGTVFYDITPEKAFEKAAAEGKMVLIDFYTKTCGPCKKMKKVVFSTPECGEYVNKRFVPIMLDGEDGGIGTELAKKYDIQIFPSYLVLLPDGFREGIIMGAEYEVNKFLGMLKLILHEL